MMKKCAKCNKEKDITEFKKENSIQCLHCNEIGRKKCKKYYIKHKELIKEKQKNYINLNPVKRKETLSKYYNKNKKEMFKKADIRIRERRKKDPIFKMQFNIRAAIRSFFREKNFSKPSKTQTILGCTFQEFREHIEKQFEPWMNWNNYGLYNGELNYGWDIDHVVPISEAKTEIDVLKLNHHLNLQPLCSKVNRDIKKNKLS